MDTGIHTPSYLSREDGAMAKLDLLSLLGRPGTEPAYGAQNYRERKPRGT